MKSRGALRMPVVPEVGRAKGPAPGGTLMVDWADPSGLHDAQNGAARPEKHL